MLPTKHDPEISIHAPAKGATSLKRLAKAAKFISIHAPAKGATSYTHNQGHCLAYFNPRTREGCDDRISKWCYNDYNFNPRTREGCDEVKGFVSTVELISIHAPAKGATLARRPNMTTALISIHAPAKGATMREYGNKQQQAISIHAPAKGATATSCPQTLNMAISIHAPAKGATFLLV